jgi:hypothetical protein
MKRCQSDFTAKKRVQVPFKSERQIRPKTRFVLQGMQYCRQRQLEEKGVWEFEP